MRRRVGSVLGGAALVLASGGARAEPQWNVGVLPGLGWSESEVEPESRVRFFGGVRADVLLGRRRGGDFGVGPFAGVSTLGFSDLRIGGGASALLPLLPSYPLVVSLGTGGSRGGAGWEAAVAGWIFWGARGYNFHGSYSAAVGLAVGLEQGLGEERARALVVALHLDGMLLALPALVGYEWLQR